MEYRRVRSIIPYLNYAGMISEGIIPNLDDCFPAEAFVMKKYPSFVYQSKAFDHFGMLVDYLIRGALRIQGKCDVFDEQMSDELYYTTTNLNEMAESARQIVSRMYDNEVFTKAEIQSYIPTLVNITKSLMIDLTKYELTGLMMYNAELTYQGIQGHPDIIVGDAVLDIKTTSSFTKMKEDTYLQILIYWAISECNTVGVVLPNQRLIAVADLSECNKLELQTILSMLSVGSPTEGLDNRLGSTIHKGTNLSKSVAMISPCQVFVSNARSGKMDANIMTDAKEAAIIIKDNRISCYIHAPYTINLCNPAEDDDYQMTCLTKNLKVGIAMGAKGVVVHTGARKKSELKAALDMMETNVRKAIEHATPSCPLMLETPVGEGTEVVTTKEELNDFFNRFIFDEKCKLRLCLDTCHVFASGIDPLEYLEWWIDHSDIPIGLIHFNDSATEFGSHKDRHAPAGDGYIGKEKMMKVYCIAQQYGIDMVTE